MVTNNRIVRSIIMSGFIASISGVDFAELADLVDSALTLHAQTRQLASRTSE